MSEYILISCFHIFFQIFIISYIAVVNCNPQFLYHIINQQPYPYQHFGPPLIWFQGPPIIHSPYPFGKIQSQIAPKDQKKSPYSADTGWWSENYYKKKLCQKFFQNPYLGYPECLKRQKKVICHRIFFPYIITPIFGENH